jgi:molecular chaperone GrpE
MEEQTTNNEQAEADSARAEGHNGENAAPTQPPAAEELQQRMQQIEQESASYKDQYLRAAAEMKNYKRRVEQERGELIRNASASVLMKLLPILDDFDLAMAHVPEEIASSPWFNGIKLVQTKLQAVLEGEGVKPIQALGETFDPNFHEAVMHEDAGPEHAGKVTAELRRGYLLHDRVIRATMVKVGEG